MDTRHPIRDLTTGVMVHGLMVVARGMALFTRVRTRLGAKENPSRLPSPTLRAESGTEVVVQTAGRAEAE